MIHPQNLSHLYSSQQLKAMYPTQSVGALSSHAQSQINENTKADKVSISPAAKLALEKAQTQEQDNTRYQAILEKAQKANATNNPQGFLASLSQSDYQFLNKMHNIAIIDNPKDLSYEGALNLILPTNLQQDTNNDGIVSVGKANMIKIPPPNTPDNIKKAFSDALNDMPEEQKMDIEAIYVSKIILANIREGRLAQPEDADFRNPFSKAGFSYRKDIESLMSNIDAFNPKATQEEKQKLLDAFTKLRTAFVNNGVD